LLYYGLNLLSIRKAQALEPYVHRCSADGLCFHFSPTYEGAWARLTPAALEWLASRKIDALVKFGLDLLEVEPSAPPILSWHHGDPEFFRGRPAGFYELLQGRPFVGQMVQRLTNELDAGEVLCSTETRVHPHSYRKTLSEAYALSPYLLAPAIDALMAARRTAKPVSGQNYRLPDNRTVLRFIGQRVSALAHRLAYGAFREKHWRSSTAPAVGNTSDVRALVERLEAERARWTNLAAPRGFRFLADPFFGNAGDELFVEGYRASNGKGVILCFSGGTGKVLEAGSGFHLSYPGSFTEGGVSYVIPEMSQGGKQAVYRVESDRLIRVRELDIDAGPLLDPTLLLRDGRVYLFANLASEGASILRLWTSSGLFEHFEEHDASPIRASARGSRMAGAIREIEGELVRYGQDCRRSYGDGVLAFAIEELTERTYRETGIAVGAFTTANGPHTLNFCGDVAAFDWYCDRFSPLAGVRRYLSRFGGSLRAHI
jgi:hypothetical protein